MPEPTLPPLVASTLYLVATPIGNREDITHRALRTLRECDVVAAEDTRRTGQLLNYFGISRPLLSYFRFNEARAVKKSSNAFVLAKKSRSSLTARNAGHQRSRRAGCSRCYRRGLSSGNPCRDRAR
jgi:hypothetical protein